MGSEKLSSPNPRFLNGSAFSTLGKCNKYITPLPPSQYYYIHKADDLELV